MIFHDRAEAGRLLADKLADYAGRSDVAVLGLPRGGIPVAFEVARELHAPLDVFLVRKLGVPGYEELAMGALATGGVRVLNEEVTRALGISEDVVESIAAKAQDELERRELVFRGNRPPLDLGGRIVILVDDGLATGSTMKAAVAAVCRQGPAQTVIAVPVGSQETCAELQSAADEIVCLRTPDPFRAVGLWYKNFSQTTDQEVRDLLQRAEEEHALASRGA
jgi:putative phosphoribosyl transferase